MWYEIGSLAARNFPLSTGDLVLDGSSGTSSQSGVMANISLGDRYIIDLTWYMLIKQVSNDAGGYHHPVTREWQAERHLTKVCTNSSAPHYGL